MKRFGVAFFCTLLILSCQENSRNTENIQPPIVEESIEITHIENNYEEKEMVEIEPFIIETIAKANRIFEENGSRYRIFDVNSAISGASGESIPNYKYDVEMISGIADSLIIKKKLWENEILKVLERCIPLNDFEISFSEVSDSEKDEAYKDFSFSMELINKKTQEKYVIWPNDFKKEYLFFIMYKSK